MDLYVLTLDSNSGTSYGSPVYNKKEELVGVCGLDISFEFLTRLVSSQKVSEHGYSFIITGLENLVAFPSQYPFDQAKLSPNQRINVHNMSVPLIDKSIDIYKVSKIKEFSLDFNGKTYLAIYQPIKDL